MGFDIPPQRARSDSKADAMGLMPPHSLSINVPAIASLSSSASASHLSVLSDDITETPRTTSWWMDTTFNFLAGGDNDEGDAHDQFIPQLIVG